MHPLCASPEDIAQLLKERQTMLTRMRSDLRHHISARYRPVDPDMRKAQLAHALYLRYSIRLLRRNLRTLKENFNAPP